MIKTVAISSLFLAFSFWSWKSLYDLYKQLKSQRLFHERHNAVLMWANKKGLSGWIPGERIKLDISTKQSLHVLFEPILYFIKTAEISLDLAYMTITSKEVFRALLEAKSRGVHVRLLSYLEPDKSSAAVRELIDKGIEVQLYIADSNSIMHNKFIIKDFTKTSGYTLMGSMNLSDNAFYNNYEDVVITSNWEVTRAFHDNFQKCWEYMKEESKTVKYQTILADCNLIKT